MKKFHVTHKIITTSIVGTLTIGATVSAAYAYQAMAQYKPSSAKDDMKNNQVLFNNNKNSLNNSNNGQNNSKWLQKENQNEKKDATQNSNYLFDKNQNVAVQKTMTISNTTTSSTNTDNASNSNDKNSTNTSDSNTVVDIDKNAKNPDIIISDDKKGTSGKDNTSSGTESNDNPDKKDNREDNTHGGNNSGGNSGGDTSGGKINYDKIKDPTYNIKVDTKKEIQNMFANIKDFDDTKVEETQKNSKYTRYIEIRPSLSYGQENMMLYSGYTLQKNELLNFFVTGVSYIYEQGKDDRDQDKDIFYSWNEDELSTYVRVNKVSFDNGKTWEKSNVIKIPEDVTSIRLDISYRLSKNGEWISYEPESSISTTLSISKTKLLVLNKKIDNNTTNIDSDWITNIGNQYPDVGSTLCLYEYQDKVFSNNDYLTSLFPGWEEEGKQVDWNYTVQPGRHFLEPMDPVPLDSDYLAKLDVHYQTVFGEEQLCAMQTLVDTKKKENLKVPDYIQMLDFEKKRTFDTVELPDTVAVVHDDNITVKDKWIVSKKNQNLAVKDGILMSKDLSRIISVPNSVDTITITKKIKSLDVGKLDGKTIYVTATDMDDLPEIPYEKLKDCKIILKDSIFDTYISDHYDSIVKGNNIKFAKKSEEDKTYTVSDHCIVTGNTLYKALKGTSKIYLSANIDSLEKDCFDDSDVKYIYCENKKQKEIIESLLQKLGYIDIKVYISQTQDGLTYVIDDDGIVTLLNASSDIVEFDGYVGNVLVDQIGDGAFKDCTSLQSVYLPENIKVIGEEAFENCSNLEEVLINSRDTITIGNNAFDGLSSIRMIASNAQKANMEDDYSLNVKRYGWYNVFFVPSNHTGYNGDLTWFNGDYGPYTVENIGKTGKAIYLNDLYGTPFLVLSTSACVDEQVQLLDTTTQIFEYAFADCFSPSGTFNVNLESLSDVYYNSYAFYNSNIGENVVIGKNSTINYSTFDSCQYIQSVEIQDGTKISSYSFSWCNNLSKVQLKNVNNLESHAFYNCESLKKIVFEESIPNLCVSFSGMPFSFAGFNLDGDIDQNIKIELKDVGISTEEFLYRYLYLFAGYEDDFFSSASQSMWEAVKVDLCWPHWDEGDYDYEPTYDEMYDAFKAKLLEAENKLRAMLGLELVSEPTNMPTDIPTKEEYEGKEDSEESDEENKDSGDETETDEVDSSSDENGSDVEENQNEDLKSDEDSNISNGDNENEPESFEDVSDSDEFSDSTEQSVEINEEDFQ